MKAKLIKLLFVLLALSTFAWALTDEEKEIVANIDFFMEYEIIERDDFQEIYVDSTIENDEEESSQGTSQETRKKKK